MRNQPEDKISTITLSSGQVDLNPNFQALMSGRLLFSQLTK